MTRDEQLRAARLAYWYARAKGQAKLSTADLAKLLLIPESEVSSVMPSASMLMSGLQWTGKALLVSMPNKAKTLKPADPEMFKPPPPPKPPPGGREVYLHWVNATGRSAVTSRFTPGRSKVVKARMAEGYTVAELCRAIDGCAASPWHQGDNPEQKRWDDLTLICRNGEKVEAFIELAGGGGRAKPVHKAKGLAQTTTYGGLDDIAMSQVIYGSSSTADVVSALRRADLGKWLQPAADELQQRGVKMSVDDLRALCQGVEL